MQIIYAQNVNDAWPMAIDLILEHGEYSNSRNGGVRVAPWPVVTCYSDPTQRVLFDPVRDANPIFHLHEALWMLAGRDDATWLDQFVGDFSKRFAEEGGVMHGAYGKRWRDHFGGNPGLGLPRLDQLDEVVRLLKANSDDRQAVIQMWDPTADLGVPGLKDRPCNLEVILRVRRIDNRVVGRDNDVYEDGHDAVLDITVPCRSNDIVYGAYGANAVHFSVLQEYLAARIGVGVGVYYQVSNNFHVYDWAREKVDLEACRLHWQASRNVPYPETRPLVDAAECFDDDLRDYLRSPEHGDFAMCINRVFHDTAQPMFRANVLRKKGDLDSAMDQASLIAADDWRVATEAWIMRRMNARAAKVSS